MVSLLYISGFDAYLSTQTVLTLWDRYDSEGRNASFTAYTNSTSTRTDNNTVKPSEIKNIGQAKDENLGMGEKTDYFSTQAVVAFIKQETFSYPACANPDGCNKKVMDNGDGWMCEKCDRKWPEPIHRYVVSHLAMPTKYTGL